MSNATARVGIIGCGNIAPVYVRTLQQLGWIEVAQFADGVNARAEEFAALYGGRAVSVDEMLADPSVDAVVNLTPAHAHAAVTRLVVEAGKAVFSEKPLGIDFDEGRSLVDLAAEKGVSIGCAPDTFLGTGLQAARAAIDKGLIGEPLAANAFMLGFGPEWWHPNPEIFYGAGAGPLFDMGPYYLTALTTLLGPAASIAAAARVGIADRVVHSKGRVGDRIAATAPTHVASLIEFTSGAIGTLVTSFDVKATRYRNIEIYGSEATLSVPDPNTFGGPLRMRSIIADDWRDLPLATPNIPQQRGIGLADMLSAMRHGRPHRASATLALHVLELMTGALLSAETGSRYRCTTTMTASAPMRYSLPANMFD